MLLTRFNPYREMSEFRRNFDRLNSLLSHTDVNTGTSVSAFTPAVNTREGTSAYHIEVDLPGVKKEDIDVNISEGVVTLSGERSVRNELKEDNYYKVESEYGKFERSFSIPKDADIENIHAETADGVLEVVIPKLEVTKDEPRKIEIK